MSARRPDVEVEYAAYAIALGAVVRHAFAHAFALTTRPDADSVRALDLMLERGADHVRGLTTARNLMPRLFEWSRLPSGLEPGLVLAMIERLFNLGAFGFRAPAAAHIPDHLVTWHSGIRSVLVITPGHDCPSNALLARATDLIGAEYLASKSTPTTVLDFHRLGTPNAEGRPTLIVERDGSLPIDTLRPIMADFGFGLRQTRSSVNRLPLAMPQREPPNQRLHDAASGLRSPSLRWRPRGLPANRLAAGDTDSRWRLMPSCGE